MASHPGPAAAWPRQAAPWAGAAAAAEGSASSGVSPAALAAARTAAQAASLDCLPDELLAKILGLAGREEGRSTTLVCKRWLAAFYSGGSGLWTSLKLSAPFRSQKVDDFDRKQWLAHKCSQLQRIARGCQLRQLSIAYAYDLTGGWGAVSGQGSALAELLLALEPGCTQLQALRLGSLFKMRPEVAAWLGRRSSLSFLACCTPVLSAAIAALHQLSTLRSLELSAVDMSAADISSILMLRQLAELQMWTGGTLPPAFDQLTALTHLRRLDLRTRTAKTVIPPPASFLHLTRWEFAYSDDGAYFFFDPPPGLHVSGVQASLQRMSLVSLPDDSGSSNSSSVSLQLCKLRPLEALPPLLVSLLPGHLTLRSLDIEYPLLDAPAVTVLPQQQQCPFLPGLTSLTLSNCGSSRGVNPSGALAALLQQAPRLAELRVCSGQHSGAQRQLQLPPCLLGAPALRRLSLRHYSLHHLPAGPYLRGLEALELYDASLEEFPAVLAEATSLTRLDLSGNPRLLLDSGGAWLLLRMPHLQELELGGARAMLHALLQLSSQRPHLHISFPNREARLDSPDSDWCVQGEEPEEPEEFQDWDATGLRRLSLRHCSLHHLPDGPCLRGLEELELVDASLEKVPAALVEATSLTRLDLSGNPRLLLDIWEAGVLLCMPHLRDLELSGARVMLHALVQLASQRPHLRIGFPDREARLDSADSVRNGHDELLHEYECWDDSIW